MVDALAAGVWLAGRYELQATLGRGGMATVYRAWDHDRKRPCAVKVLSESLSGDEQFRRRFRQEAAAAQGLSHRNIVRVDDWGEAGSHHYIVMEYVAGGTLRDLMRRCGPLAQPVALRIAVEVAEALAHAHDRGVVHRDIKPENLLLAEDGRIKVADFGIARTVDAAALTRTGIVMGSARYLSPEQARGDPAGPLSDLYALGVVLFEMLAGRVPFDGDSAVAIAVQHVHEQPPRLQLFRPEVVAPIAACVERLLAKREEDRYSTAAALAEELRRCGALPPGAVEDGVTPKESLARVREATTDTAHLERPGLGALAISRTAPLAPDGVAAAAGATAALPAGNTMRIGGTLAPPLPRPSIPRTPPRSEAARTRRRPGDFRLAAVVVLMLVLATILGSRAYWTGRRLVAVPSLVGQSVSAASSTVGALGLRLVVAARRQDARIPIGLIVAQDPPPGLVGNALEVRVVVSQGSGIVPDLHGLSFGEATRLVQMAGLRVQLVGDVGGLAGGEDRAHVIVFQFQPAGMRLGPDAAVYVLLGTRVEKHPDPVPGRAPPRHKDGSQER